jgi:hypothetical protein
MSENLTYKVKCRSCNKITEMYFGTLETTTKETFNKWFSEHSTFPIEKQCDCDNGSILLHDLVSKKIIF